MIKPLSPKDFPPGMHGGLENDREDHRVGEAGQTGPEAPGDIDRARPAPRGGDAPREGDKPTNQR